MIRAACLAGAALAASPVAAEVDGSVELRSRAGTAVGAADAVPIREALALSGEDYARCLAALDEIGVSYVEADPIVAADDPDCGILRPVEVSEVLPGIAFKPPNPLRCSAALATAR